MEAGRGVAFGCCVVRPCFENGRVGVRSRCDGFCGEWTTVSVRKRTGFTCIRGKTAESVLISCNQTAGESSESAKTLKQALESMLGSVEIEKSDSLSNVVECLAHTSIVLANKIAHAPLAGLFGLSTEETANASGDVQKKLDVVANELFKSALTDCGSVGVIASEEEQGAVKINDDGSFVVVFDPLDGSRNIDASIPTGTIFGIYRRDPSLTAEDNALQPGNQLVASGYTLYASATQLAIALRDQGVHIFTLDHSRGEFLLSHPHVQVPRRGQIYSLNDARYFDWTQGLRDYIDKIRQAQGQNPVKYSARYVCSLVADFHRTILFGGWAGNPRSHLRLVYEANPLAMIAEEAGGSGSDGTRNIRSIIPSSLHERLPLFLGSRDDIAELETFDVQQRGEQVYTV